jgi:hypothetical protein
VTGRVVVDRASVVDDVDDEDDVDVLEGPGRSRTVVEDRSA